MRRTPPLVALFLGLAFAASACSGSSGGSDGGGSGSEGGSSDSATTTTAPTYVDLDPADITFSPVLEIRACAGTTVPDESTTTEASEDETVPSADGTLCYVLGPAAGNGTALSDAKVYADGVGIQVSVDEGSQGDLNEMFNACFAADATCPEASTEGQGYAAVVIDGQVISTPAITEEDVASSPFVITGDFDKNQATNIATAINGE